MPLLNAFIDGIVCVGFNSEQGLTIDRQSEDKTTPLSVSLQPYLLAVITADQAIYTQSDGKYFIDPSYPLICPSKSSSGGQTSNSKSQKKPLIPVAYNNLPIFCSPDGVKISYLPEDSRIHHIVFTQEEGTRSYAVVLTFQQKFTLKNDKPDEDGTYQIETIDINTIQANKKSSNRPSAYRYTNTNTNHTRHYSSPHTGRLQRHGSASSLTFDSTEPFYVPHYVVLISNNPYWTSMHEVVSTIYNEILQNEIEPHTNIYKTLLQKYAFLACNTPIPPIAWDRFSLSFSLIHDQSAITLDPPTHTNRSVLDLDLSILLLTLNTGKLIDVLAAILTQQPIIFFSSDYSKLVTTLECLLYLIYPFKWIHIYIPIVPYSLRDYYLEGPPGSYIMGVHSRHEEIVEELGTSLTCNLDNDANIHVPPDTEFARIPAGKLRRFIGPITKFIEQIINSRSSGNFDRPIRLRVEEQREIERRHRFETNNKIIDIFLDLMVDLCDDTLKAIYWKMDHQQSSPTNSLQRSTTLERRNAMHNQTKFSKEKYLLSKTEGHERDFYRLFMESTGFQQFIDEERSATTSTEFRKICQLRSQINRDQPYHFNTTTTTDEQIKSTTSVFDAASNQMLLELPNWPSNISTHYLDDCIEIFTYELETAEEEHLSPVISVYAYLRGCAYIARGLLLEGLRDLYLIENSNLFPKHYIQTIIIPLLSDAGLYDRFIQESFYIKSPEWKKFTNDFEESDNSSNSSTDLPPLPQGDISFDQFLDYVQRSSIVTDLETITILFKALLYYINITANKTSEIGKPRRRWSLGGNNSPKEPTNESNNIKNGGQTIDLNPNRTLPAKFFELFLEIWQQTSAEKARMIYCLPRDRQKQESILMISSENIISKNNGRGKLILTQRGIYLLPESHSSASLLTELLKVVFIDTHQHKTIFSSSKPAVLIYALHQESSTNQQNAEPLDTLIFKDNNEQNFWFKIIWELWSGVSIAQEECDTTVLNKISTHMELLHALTNIDQNDSINDRKSKSGDKQAYIDMVLNYFTVFTRMQKNGISKRLTHETRKALHGRLSPSINETVRYSVSCLIFTENRDSRYSLLWCAYGNKLKIFNTKTWICDPNEMLFPSLITCMCLDASNKIWIGCKEGQLFIVDTIQRICGTQLTLIKGTGGCQSMAFDKIRNQILISNRSGLLTIWNTINKQRLNDVNLDEIYKNVSEMQEKIHRTEMLLNIREPLPDTSFTFPSATNQNENKSSIPNELRKIQIYDDLLYACYRDDYILIFHITHNNKYIYNQIVSVRYRDSSLPINSFIVYNQQLWISAINIIYVFNIINKNNKTSYELIMKSPLEDDHLLTMLGVSDYIWAGSSRGNVYIFRMDNYDLLKTFDGHKDGVCCLCPMLDTYVISGSQQYDTSIVIWENIPPNNIVTSTRL